jgi:hypothetical protein
MSDCASENRSYEFSTDTSVADRMAREVYVIGGGLLLGTVKEIQDHPIKSGLKVYETVVAGATLGALAAAELPIVSIGAIGVGAIMTSKYAWDLLNPSSQHNRARNATICSAARIAWRTGDHKTIERSHAEISQVCGTDAFDLFTGIAGGSASRIGSGATSFLRLLPDLPALRPIPACATGRSYLACKIDLQSDTEEHFSDYVDFMKHGKLVVHPLSSVEPVSGDWTAPPKENVLTLEETGEAVIVHDSRGNALQEDKATGQLTVINNEGPQTDPNGPDENPAGTVVPHHFHKDQR